jgi:hypothetical protein
MTMLPNLPAPMTAKFVYPDMIELKLWTGCLSYGSIRVLPSFYLFSFRTIPVDVQLFLIRPSYCMGTSTSFRTIMGIIHLREWLQGSEYYGLLCAGYDGSYR